MLPQEIDMHGDKLELRIQEYGRELFRLIKGERPSLYNTNWWSGKVLDWAMRNEEFKVQLFRFVDVLPSLANDDALARHVEEYFGRGSGEIPAVLRWGSKSEGALRDLMPKLLAGSLKKNIEAIANRFIIGEKADQAVRAIKKIRDEGFAFCVDILGEAVLSETEADSYQARYLTLLQALNVAQTGWPALGTAKGSMDWGDAPRINFAVKPTSFYSQTDPKNFAGSVAAIHRRLLPLAEEAVRIGAFMCIDMEQHRFKDITLAVYRRLKQNDRLKKYPFIGVVLQSYLKESRQDLDDLLAWAKTDNIPVSVRLVKGAYWEYETVIAAANGWPSPVYGSKAETDANFEAMAAAVLANHEVCHLACASHNIRSISTVRETAVSLKVPVDRYEFQMLYGMAGPVRRAVLQATGRLRLYGPYGPLLPGMGYLVRRLLENTSNQSFLRQHFTEGLEVEQLLKNPAVEIISASKEDHSTSAQITPFPGLFANEPVADFSRKEVRDAFPAAITTVRQQGTRHYPLLLDDKEINGRGTLQSANPADPDEIIGSVSLAGPAEIDLAVTAAAKALPEWRTTPVKERAACLFRAAELLRREIYELAALQILEVGKQWHEAHADVTEAIDFCEYYGREMLRLDERGGPIMSMPGEENRYFHTAKGIAAVIAPWNFPIAISCGMCSAALVTGNCVLYKPSGLAPVCGARLAWIFRKAGLPTGVFNFVPCRGEEIGDYLVSHPGIHLIAFTGSMEIGKRIVRLTSEPAAGQHHLKKIIAEMGGKNAIIVDDDADLDEAVPAVLRSAFGFQGQKCSACSRVIVVETMYDRFVERLIDAARSLSIGPAENSAHVMGPVIDRQARDKILSYLEVVRQEGEILYQSQLPKGGWYVPLTLVGNITVQDRISREEIFGPVLALMKAPTFAEAIAMANETDFGLTGGVFSRSPANLAMAAREFRVGNLYLNRSITGALVGRQPFGGFKMSGIGSKAGGPDYLLQFVDPMTVCENTMRRGFAPEVK